LDKLRLQQIANEVRKGIIEGVHSAKAGHPGGSLSAADVFTYLYFEEMNIDPKEPVMEERDRFVLSKGHNAPGFYSVLAQRGFFSGGGFEDAAPYGFLSSGPSGHEAYSGSGYVQRLPGAGNLGGCGNGVVRQDG